MSKLFSGGCSCGSIRYECTADPAISFNCHCRDCQRASSGAFYSAVVVPSSAVTFTKGDPKYSSIQADSGNTKHYGFCPDCGNPIDARIDEDQDIWVIAAGTFDEPQEFKPTVDFYTRSAQPWVRMDPALKKYETEPDDLTQLLGN